MTDWKTQYDELVVTFERLRSTFNEQHEKWMALSQEQQGHIARLFAQVRELKANIAATSVPAVTPGKALGAREQESLLKLVIGMAVGGYGYDHAATRSGQSREIAGDLELAGVPLDVDTVRKWLKLAAELLPSDRERTRQTE